MSGKGLDVFSLRDSVVADYKRFATSFTTIHADDIRQQVEAIYAKERYWPEPLIQINPSYRRSTTIDKLAASGALDPRCAEIFRTPPTTDAPNGEPLALYKHQEQALALASQGESYVVTTGTGSGKSLCFFIPIVNAVLQEKRATAASRTRAIIIYPMNALANSQLEELDKFVSNVPGEKPVTFDRYTGQDDAETRRRIAENPPDILLTNFMMLELLMTRQDEVDRRVMANCAGLRFLVLDELHTYRGRQGADVALLVRRVRERLAPRAPPVHRHVGHDGQRGLARGQEPRRRSRRVEALLDRDPRKQRHRRDARPRHRLRAGQTPSDGARCGYRCGAIAECHRC